MEISTFRPLWSSGLRFHTRPGSCVPSCMERERERAASLLSLSSSSFVLTGLFFTWWSLRLSLSLAISFFSRDVCTLLLCPALCLFWCLFFLLLVSLRLSSDRFLNAYGDESQTLSLPEVLGEERAAFEIFRHLRTRLFEPLALRMTHEEGRAYRYYRLQRIERHVRRLPSSFHFLLLLVLPLPLRFILLFLLLLHQSCICARVFGPSSSFSF